jgi:hypothetical protein
MNNSSVSLNDEAKKEHLFHVLHNYLQVQANERHCSGALFIFLLPTLSLRVIFKCTCMTLPHHIPTLILMGLDYYIRGAFSMSKKPSNNLMKRVMCNY